MQDTRRRPAWAMLVSATFASSAFAGIEVELDGPDDEEVRGAVRAAMTLTQYRKREVTAARARFLYAGATEEIVVRGYNGASNSDYSISVEVQ